MMNKRQLIEALANEASAKQALKAVLWEMLTSYDCEAVGPDRNYPACGKCLFCIVEDFDAEQKRSLADAAKELSKDIETLDTSAISEG